VAGKDFGGGQVAKSKKSADSLWEKPEEGIKKKRRESRDASLASKYSRGGIKSSGSRKKMWDKKGRSSCDF